jgi:hypothetical protein
MSKLNMPAIIPVAGMNTEFGMEWDSSLMPVGPNYTAIEATIYECLHAGCSSIWIVANDDIAPLIKYRIGEWATDVESIERGTYIRFGNEKHKEVPVYYVPIHPRHRDKVDCYSWSIIYGINVAYWLMIKMGRWIEPDQYYVSFPLSALDPREVYKHKSTLKKNVPFYFSHNGKTVKDGLPLSFVLEADEWRRAKRMITTNAALYKLPPPGEMPSEKLPPEERRKSLSFSLEDVFGDGPKGYELEIKEFYDLTTWAEYVKFISSDLGKRTKRPGTKTMYRGRRK